MTLLAWLLLLAAAPASRETPAAREQARACLAEQSDAAVQTCRGALEMGLRAERAAVLEGVLADRLAADERWEEAAAALEEWCRLAPADPEPRRRLADVLLFGLGRADEAVARLEQATALGPPDASSFGALGVARAAAGRYAEAVEAFDTAARLDPAFFELRPTAQAIAEAARRREAWPALPAKSLTVPE